MTVEYYLMDPTGNRTVLVTSPVEKAAYPAVAKRLLDREKTAEQVGFLSGTHLMMAGGEFCGNASMAAAFLIAGGEPQTVSLTVSGADRPVTVRIDADRGTVRMPEPIGITDDTVILPGICHSILFGTMERKDAEREVKRRCERKKAPAMGLMMVEDDRLTPLVYVPGAGTLYWESSCASGTAAVGYYLARLEKRAVTRTFREPGGELTVAASPDGKVTLSGTVRVEKKAWLSFQKEELE